MLLRTAFWSLLFLAVLLTLLSSPASAQVSGWSFGGAFSLGGAHFRVGFAEVGPYGPDYYFEVARPLSYPGHACSSQCYRRGGRHYHHPTCGRIHHHFQRYGYAPDHFIAYYGPPVAFYPPPSHYGYYHRPAWRYARPGYCCDRHYRKGRPHHRPPGHYKKHYRHHYHDD